MGPVRQIPEIRTGAFASNKREKFGFDGVFLGENRDCLLRKSLCRLSVQFPKEYDVERSSPILDCDPEPRASLHHGKFELFWWY